MAEKIYPFLGAATAEGFKSFFGELQKHSSSGRLFILKGGPGTGKSTFMKKTAAAIEAHGIKCERYSCSSDPTSLDAVIFPDISCAIADGTAPHAMDPAANGAGGRTIDLGACWDPKKLVTANDEILVKSEISAAFYGYSYKVLAAVTAVHKAQQSLFFPCINTYALQNAARKMAARIFDKSLPEKTRRRGKTAKFFGEAVSFCGLVTPVSEIIKDARRIYLIKDSYMLAPLYLETICAEASFYGHDAKLYYTALDGGIHAIHAAFDNGIIFITQDKNSADLRLPDFEYTAVSIKRFVDTKKAAGSSQRAALLKKLKSSLVNEASDAMSNARSAHMELERIYTPAMDFELVEKERIKTENAILELAGST